MATLDRDGRLPRRPWRRIGPRLLSAVMVPIVALSALGVLGAIQRFRDTETVAGVVARVDQVQTTLRLYAALVAESNASQSIVAAAAYGISAAQATQLLGLDVEARLRSSRAAVDAAMAGGGRAILGRAASELVAMRTQIDQGVASEATVRATFDNATGIAAALWSSQAGGLTHVALASGGSSDFRRAVSGLRDAVDALVSGINETTAAAALDVPGVPGPSSARTDLAAANALYTRAASGLLAELSRTGRATWSRRVVHDGDIKSFQRFLDGLLQPAGASGGSTIAEIARTFRAGLIFTEHLRAVVTAAATDVQSMARTLRSGAERVLVQYLVAIGAIAVVSAAIAIGTAQGIVRPLRRLARRAADVNQGVIDGDHLLSSGPPEVASVIDAFNEIVANLRALDATAMALAAADLANPVLGTHVPGRIGESLRHSVDLLERSVRDNAALRRDLERNEARFKELADGSPDIIWRISRQPEVHFDYLSPSFEVQTGIPSEVAMADFGVFAGALEPEAGALLADALAGLPIAPRFDISYRRADGSVVVFEVRVVETEDAVLGVARDVTEIRALQAQLADRASRDALTGLANRRLLDELLERAVRRSDRSGTQVTVAFLDLDNFKAVNDVYGHDAGDRVLQVTAARLEATVRDADVIARFGGDEFVVVYDSTDDAGPRIAERIQDALRLPIDIGNGVTVCCDPSVGIADTRHVTANPASLVAAADRAMLAVKEARRQAGRGGQGPAGRPLGARSAEYL